MNEIPIPPPELTVSSNIDDFLIPGMVVEVDAELAEALGAFEETALYEAAAMDANLDLADALPEELARGR